EAGIAVAKEYLKEVYGDKYREVFVPRQWGVGGAHEAIRPTRPIDVKRLRQLIEEGVIQPVRPLTRYHYALYDLVFRRFIASQMGAGKVLVKTVRVRVKGVEKTLELRTKIVEPGFLEFYQPFHIDPDVESGVYRIVNVSIMRWSPYPPYTQADVVRLMKERGIGRPSTYAKIIETLLRRRYITQIARQGYLASTVLGKAVYKFLTSRFARLVSEETTRRLQEEMDKIEEGLRDYREVLKEILEEIRSVPVKAKEP
ncbi:MAG TPA: reverse gyrase, partial [Pyrodictium sp.]|nr:reverse gyrase [Pyrodictium sp.]